MMRMLRKILLTMALCAVPILAHAETRVALVIGNANYAHVTTLANPGHDADAIAAALRAVGFSVDEWKDIDAQDLRGAILAFAHKASSADVAVVYYAGHGVQVDGLNYLIPVDAALDSAASLSLEAIPAEAVLSAVERAHRLRLLILDACRENPFKAQLAAMGRRDIFRGLAPITAPGLGDTLIAYSAKDGTVALDGKGANSPYAAALARHLTERGTEIDKLFREVRGDVLASTGNAQEPYVYGSRTDDFYFVPGTPNISATLNALVQQAVDAARAAERQARERAGDARLAAQRAEKAAQLAEAGSVGYGVQTDRGPAGVTYRWEGQLTNNHRDGVGTLVYFGAPNDGDRYAGEWRNDVRNGVGVLAYANGERYEGEERDDAFNGVGVYTVEPTATFRERVGHFANNKANGYGVLYWRDGTVWIGSWKDDYFSGYGAKLDAQGRVIEQGYYELDRLKTAMTP